jgi:uncharacterized protein (UPF0333 family)
MDDDNTKKTNTKRRLKLLIPLGILVVIVAAVALFIKNMNGPAQGSIATTVTTQAAIKPATTQQQKHNGKFISFTIPEHYKIVPSQQSSGYLEIVSLDNTNHSGKYVSIGVLKEALANDSGINYRKSHPELYKQLSSSADKIVFQGTSAAAELTGFISHGSFVTTISLTANGKHDLSVDFGTIVNSLDWKQ